MCDTCDDCDCLIFCGLGMGCRDGMECDCDCHAFDARTALEIVETHKQAKPDLDVSVLAGVHRNKLPGYFEDTMDCDEISRAFELNFLKPGLKGPPIRSDHVPMNVEQLLSKTEALAVQFKRQQSGPAQCVSGQIFSEGLHQWNDPKKIAEAHSAESGKLERTAGIIVKAGDLLSRANAMIKASRSASKGPIAKRPLAAKRLAARKPVGGKKKPCRIA